MASDRDTNIRAAARSVVLDVLRRRAAGESLTDEQVIDARPELADLLRIELERLRHVCAAGEGVESDLGLDGSTADSRSAWTPGMLQLQCPHCREHFEAPRNTSVTDIVCSVCGGQFSLADDLAETRAAAAFVSLAHFDLVEKLGVGGFSSVWKARDRKLDRMVAVKIPHRGTLNNEDLEKLLREARAAAQLQHPNIVRVYEVGRNGDSAYIVSDFVRGIPLNDWLVGQQPTMREAAAICATIADALQHAHDRGVIHRDLKPANFLIDGEGRPHLMDFGLARREAGEVTVTVEGQVLGTPAYMSPEQAQGESHAADGRSDVYSLGVILFELLTGELPFRGNPRMLLHQVIHDEPPSPRKFNGHIAKDLETITLKCLEKDLNRRYDTAGELSGELRCFLAGEPIRARPLSRAVRGWRWAKRRPAAAALLTLLAIVTAASAAAFVRERAWSHAVLAQKIEAESERASAEAVVNFLTNDVLGKASPNAMQDKAVRDTLVAVLIEPAAATVGERFENKPLIEAAIRRMLAHTLNHLGRPDLALPHALAALGQRRKVLGDDHVDTISSLSTYAHALGSLDRWQEAEPLYKHALEQRRRVLGDEHLDTIMSMNDYAYTLRWLGRSQEAEPLSEQALKQHRILLGEDHPETIASLNTYAHVLGSLQRWQEAEPLYSHALKLRRQVLGEDHPDTIDTLNEYALVLSWQGRGTEAEPLLKKALEQRREVLGEDHPNTVKSLNSYAMVLGSLGRAEEAEAFFLQALEKARRVLGDDHFHAILARSGLADVYFELGRAEEARQLKTEILSRGFVVWGLGSAKSDPKLLDNVIETALRVSVEQTPTPIDALTLGELCLVAGEPKRAEPAIRAAIQNGGTQPCYNKSLGWCLLAQRREQEARNAFRDALKSCRRHDGSYDLKIADVDQLTAAYFLDLASEEEYAELVTGDKKHGSLPWFYIGQRHEIDGDQAAAIEAYQRCVEPGTSENSTTVYALAQWLFGKLSKQNDDLE